MDAPLRSVLARRFRADEWMHGSPRSSGLFTKDHFLGGGELSDWSLARSRPVPVPPAHRRNRFTAAVPAAPLSIFNAVWGHDESASEACLLTDVYSYDSLAATHEAMLLLLGRFESPLIQWRPDLGVGDAAFAAPTTCTPVVFARANVVYVVRNIGRDLIDVTPAVRELDANLLWQPSPAAVEPAVEDRFRKGGVALDLAPAKEGRVTAAPVWYKVLASGADMEDRDGRVVVRGGPEAGDLRIYAVDQAGTHRAASVSVSEVQPIG